MANNTDQVNSFLEREYDRTSRILRNGELFSGIQSEEANATRSIGNLKRTAEHQQMQQAESIKRKYQVKLDSLQNLQKKLMMYVNNPSMLKPDDISRISSMLGEMHQLLESQKSYEIETSNKEIEARSKQSIEDYGQRSQMVIEKHLQDAKSRLEGIMATYEPFEEYYETASFDSHIWSRLKNESVFPIINQIRLGETKINIETQSKQPISYKTPEIVPFFNQRSLTIVYKDGERDKLKNLVDNILSRCLMSAEVGNIQFHFIDGNGNGSLFFDYLKCSNKTLQLFDGKINITPQEIEGCLQKLQLTYKEIDQKIRKGESITQYNERNPKATIPYHVVVMDSFPKGMSSSYISFVMRLMKDELAAGLHFVFIVEKQDFSKVAILNSTTSVYNIPENYVIQDNLKNILQKVLSHVDENYSKEKTMLFEEYYKDVLWWKETAANFTRIPLGLSYAHNYNLLFNEEGKDGGVASANAVIVGMPGCGKSSLLNTMIVGGSIVYSPNELRFIMIDMKGVGFKQYVTEKLPHAEFIALKANPEFGLHTLKNLKRKIYERQEIFRSKESVNYFDFRRKYNSEVMPRYMIFIDEYQELLKGDTRNEVLEILEYIVRVGRALGFNIILSSQNMELPNSVLDNISHRISMRCSAAIGRSALGFYDERTPQLNTGQAIIYCENADVIQSYYLPTEENEIPVGAEWSCKAYLRLIREKWNNETNGQFDQNLVVFDSEAPALLSNNRTFNSMTYDNDMVNRELMFSPGEKYMVDGTDFMPKLMRNKNENILVVGGKLNVSTRAANTTFLSILPQLDATANIDIVSYQNRSEQTLFEEISISSAKVCKKFPNAVFHELPQDISPLLDSIIDDIEQRMEEAEKGIMSQPRLLIIYRADAEPHFEQVEVSSGYGGNSTKLVSSEQTEKLKQILENGPQVGLFCLMHFNDTDGYFNIFDEDDKVYFNHRILLQMSEDDSKTFLNSYIQKDAAQLVDNEASEENRYNMALYKNVYDNSDPVILKPYEFLD